MSTSEVLTGAPASLFNHAANPDGDLWRFRIIRLELQVAAVRLRRAGDRCKPNSEVPALFNFLYGVGQLFS